MEGAILFHVSLGDLRVIVRFGIMYNLTINMLLGTSFNYRFIGGIFPAKRKFGSWHSHLVAVLSAR